MSTNPGETSAEMKGRVARARVTQAARFGSHITLNGTMSAKQVRAYCALPESIFAWLGRAVDRLALSARGYDRVVKVARTIADIAGHESIELADVAEAVQYRSIERQKVF